MTYAAATRRDRVRSETTAEIKERAWAVMAESGADGLSLRAVARGMGMAPSALYRYFPSRDDLLTALIVDGFDSLAAEVQDAYVAAKHPDSGLSTSEVFIRVALAYRRWAVEHPTEYGLVFGSAVPGYSGTDETTAASLRSSGVLLQTMIDHHAAGALDGERLRSVMTETLEAQLREWQQRDGVDLPVEALAVCMLCYSSLHGMVGLQVNHHLPDMLGDSEDLFELCMRESLRRFTLPSA